MKLKLYNKQCLIIESCYSKKIKLDREKRTLEEMKEMREIGIKRDNKIDKR